MNNVIVTGGAGYIGSHTCKALAEAGYTPIAYDNFATGNRWAVRWGPLQEGDILDGETLNRTFATYRPVGVIHFAAASLVGESTVDPALYYRNNMVGGLNVIDMCRLFDARAFIMSSTCAVYGEPERVPIAEDQPRRPISPYGASKAMIEQALADYDAAYGIRHVALRYFNAAGADASAEIGERRPVESHLIPLAIDAALGRRPALQIYGDDYPTPDGTAIRDYVHVTDLAAVHVAALSHLLAGRDSATVNVGSGSGASVREVLSTIEAVNGRRVPHSVGPRRAGDAPMLVADATHARALFGADLTPRSDLATIVADAWRWHDGARYASLDAA